MTRWRSQIPGSWALVFLALFCAGCISTHSTTATRFYLLMPASYDRPLAIGAQTGVVLEIQSLRLPQYLEKPQIVTRYAENRLVFSEYDQWGENLRKNMVRVIQQNLSFLLSTPHVGAAPSQIPHTCGFRIGADVMAFEADPEGLVTLRVHWQVTERSSGRLVAARLSDITCKARGRGMDKVVAAMDCAMKAFCLEMAREVLAAGPGQGKTP